MKKLAAYGLIFTLGFGACLLLLRAYGTFGLASETEAKRRAISILDKSPTGTPVADNVIIQAAAKLTPAVVNIDTLSTRRPRAYDFFGNPLQGRAYALEGKGSGVIISPDGYVVTNNHVVEGAQIIRVTLPNGRQFDGRVIGADRSADLAVVKIDGVNLPYAALGDSGKLKVGEYVIAIGYPLGIGTTVTHGIVSATDRKNLEISEGRVLREAIQTDAPINKGNSGGALANTHGELVGINTAIASEGGGGSIGIGFSIPINSAREIVKRIIASGRSVTDAPGEPWLGIMSVPLEPDYAAQLSLPAGQGVVLQTVIPLTAAAKSGLNAGDVLFSVNGKPIMNPEEVRNLIRKHNVGDQVTLGVIRADGSRQQLKVRLGRRPEQTPG